MSESTEAGLAVFDNSQANLSTFSQTLPLKISIVIILMYVMILWFLLVKYVWEDSRIRSNNALFQRLSLILVILFNFPGLLLYFILRPALTFKEKKRLDLEDEIIELQLKELREKELVNEDKN